MKTAPAERLLNRTTSSTSSQDSKPSVTHEPWSKALRRKNGPRKGLTARTTCFQPDHDLDVACADLHNQHHRRRH